MYREDAGVSLLVRLRSGVDMGDMRSSLAQLVNGFESIEEGFRRKVSPEFI